MLIRVQYLALLLFIFVMLQLPRRILCHPPVGYRKGSPSSEDYPFDPEDMCKTNDTIEELCQRCAKSTLSDIVYPLCCNNQEDARRWCDRYLHFGIH